MKKLKNILKYKYIFFLICMLLSIYRANIPLKTKYNIKDNYFEGTIIDYKLKSDYLTFILKGKEKIKCNYYFKSNEKININYGDKITLFGNLKIPNNNTIPNTFNYKKYLNNNDIYYILNIEEIINIKNTDNVIYKIKNLIEKRINKIDKTGYLNTFILGNKNNINESTYDNYKVNGIIHIFSISGMHVSILASIILYILNKIRKSDTNILFVIIFLLFYLILTNYQASITRSIVFFSILRILKLLKINIDTKDVLLISITLILFIYPKFIYNIGFLYSSLISYTLIYYSNKFNKNYILNTLLISLVSFLVSLPITINNNYEINLLSILNNLIFVPLVSFILYPLSLITFIFSFISPLFNLFINITEFLSNSISNITLLNITIPKSNIIMIIIYYIFLFLSFSKNKKYFFVLIMFIIFIKQINNLNPNYYIYFLDVGQGDMTFIKYKNNAILIDTGPKNLYSKYEITDNHLLFFNSIGVNNIDYLIITHGDLDHIGNAKYLVENKRVKNIIFNCGEFNDLEKELIKVLDKKKIPYYSCVKELNINNNKLYFLNNKDYGNENDNSSVIYTKLNDYKFLFMGDAGLEVEEDLIKKYNLQDIDVLKVGHHGSKTSSSKSFIDDINPKYSIISVGKNNRYGHPNKEVLDNLEQSKIYRTDIDGSILFKIKNNKLKIETCSP